MAIFVGTNGNDTFHGTADQDIVTFAGQASGYLIEQLEDGSVRVTDVYNRNGNTGVDILTSMDVLRFSDRDYSLAGGSGSADQIMINTYTDGHQFKPQVTLLADGGCLYVWGTFDNDATGQGIYTQRFDVNGNKIGGEVHPDIYGAELSDWSAQTIALADGGYMLMWANYASSDTTTGMDILGQRYDANGNAVGGKTLINTYVDGTQRSPSSASLSDGGYVLTWTSFDQETSAGSISGIYAQRFDANGHKVGRETQINTHTADYQDMSSVTGLVDGGYVVSWQSWGQDGYAYGIYAQRFDAGGNRVGGEVQVSSALDDNQVNPEVAALGNGGYVVMWDSWSGDGSHLQRFDADGNKVGGETEIGGEAGLDATIASLADGGFVLVYSPGGHIYAQRYDADGQVVGSRIQVDTGGYPFAPAVTGHPDGGFIVSWEGETNDETAHDILSRRFDADGKPVVSAPSGLVIDGSAKADTMNAGLGNQTIRGLAGNDLLSAGVGDDVILGGNGNDTLTGGNGKDVFRFDTAPNTRSNADKITDFLVADDTIQLENAIFAKLTSTGALKAANFCASSSGNAADTNDYVLYETDTGRIFYDGDGSGRGDKVLLATIAKHPALTVADFDVI